MGKQLGVRSLHSNGEELGWLLLWGVAPLRRARITFKDQAFPVGYLKLGGVQESGAKRSCIAAKLGEERGTEQMGGGGERGVGSSARTSVTRSDKLLLD